MARYAAFLRAVNVGGTGKLPMHELKVMCEALGYSQVKTYIASGNVVFECSDDEDRIKSQLEERISEHLGRRAAVFIRNLTALMAVVDANPFPQANGNRLMVILLASSPDLAMLEGAKFKSDEEIAAGEKCLYVHYPSGMGQSKLRIAGAEQGTARNMNTIRKMLELIQA